MLGTDYTWSDDSTGHACDISNAESVQKLMTSTPPLNAVIHLAAITFVPDSQANPTKVIDVNLKGTQHIINAMQQTHPAARLLFVSTSEVYGPPLTLPVDENPPFNPQNPYAISKAAADHYCRYIHATTGMDIVRMRPFNHSGPGQADSFVLSSFARQVAELEANDNDPVIQVGNLDAARDFMHVDDVVRAYALALEHAEPGDVYNICSSISRPIQSALDALLKRSRRTLTTAIDPSRMRPSEVPEIRGSHGAFTSKTGWQPEKTFDTLLDELLEYWRRQTAGESS